MPKENLDVNKNNSNTLKSRFEDLDTERQGTLKTARLCSKLTIPSILPPEGNDDNTRLETPYQAVGAQGVNNLSSKLLLTLLPPNRPFFKISVDDFTLAEFSDENRADVERSLGRIERAVFNEVETKALRVQVFQAIKYLAVTGNAATYQPDEGGMKVFRLNQYVVQRDSMGNLLELIIKETITPESLPEDVREEVQKEVENEQQDDKTTGRVKDNEFDLFTQVKLNSDGKFWEHKQEVKGKTIDSSIGQYKKDDSPYTVLRWDAGSGEDYGRGIVEEYLGDMLTLESLTKSLTQDSIIAARTVFLVNPNGLTKARKFQKAENGDVIDGREEDISTIKVDKHSDFQLIIDRIQTLENRLGKAFLLFSSVQRDAERVTAEEVRRLVQELENSLGGVYSTLSQEFQLPLVRRLMKVMTKQKRLPKLPDEVTDIQVVTGLEGLGRGNDLDKLITFGEVGNNVAAEAFQQQVNMNDYFTRLGTALGFDMDGLLIDPEQLEQQQTEQMASGMMEKVLPQLAKGATETPAPPQQNNNNQ